jgi:putative Holliday junction resolvase
MPYVGVDVGRRRVGLALSDASGVLATPWRVVVGGGSPSAAVANVVAALRDLRDPLDDRPTIDAIIVGLPRRLDGTDNDETPFARAIADGLASATGVPVHLQDERLTSREAESRLALREPNWRRRKQKIDAAAAAIILQDFLDAQRPSRIETGC